MLGVSVHFVKKSAGALCDPEAKPPGSLPNWSKLWRINRVKSYQHGTAEQGEAQGECHLG
jgi:hypothetical protein